MADLLRSSLSDQRTVRHYKDVIMSVMASQISRQPHDCLLNHLFRRRSKEVSKPRVTGPLCGEFIGHGEFSPQRDSNAENVSIWWRHNGNCTSLLHFPGILLAPLGLALRNDMMTSSNGNIFHVTGPLYGEFTGDRWIPPTKASEAELWCFLWSAPE